MQTDMMGGGARRYQGSKPGGAIKPPTVYQNPQWKVGGVLEATWEKKKKVVKDQREKKMNRGQDILP